MDLLNRKEGELELSTTSGECIYPNTINFDVIKNTSGGVLSVDSSNTDVATATINGNTITVIPKNVNNTITIAVTCAGTKEYKEKTVTYTLTVKSYNIGDSVNIGEYEFWVIGVDKDNVALLTKTYISPSANWDTAKNQASLFGSQLGGSGRLLTKGEAEGVAASYRNISASYWLADANGSSSAWCVYGDGVPRGLYIYDTAGVRPVLIISKSKLP